MPKVSVVIALYNQEKYVQRFINSLAAQSLEDFEAIFVDDASTDNGRDIVLAFAEQDSRFKLLRHETNKGAGAARNTGISAATGETLCFADPDDLLPENSFETRYRAYKKHNAIVRACHIEIDQSGAILSAEAPPPSLSGVFSPMEKAGEAGINPFLCAHWAWLFPTKLLQRNKILHTEGTRTAEDIQFLVRLFFYISRMVWLPDVAYYWIRQSGSLSARAYTAEHYIDYLGCVDSFYSRVCKAGRPDLGDRFYNDYLTAYLTHLCRQLHSGLSTEPDARAVVAAAMEIAVRHGLFKRFLTGKIPADNSLGVGWLYGMQQSTAPSMAQRVLEGYSVFLSAATKRQYRIIQQQGWGKSIQFDKLDPKPPLLRARYFFHKKHPDEQYRVNGQLVDIPYAKSRLVADAEGMDIFERILWLPLPKGNEEDFALTVGEQCVAGTTRSVRERFSSVAPDPQNIPPEIFALRKLAQSETIKKRFKHAWMFIDRDTQADDNAEHLYRWLRLHRPEINAYFVLREDSQDWNRLAQEGFRLVAFDSTEHKLLFLLAEHVISSQMDPYIYDYLPQKEYGDLRNCKFTCLQHGVINDDLSPWLNAIEMDCFITTTPGEYSSIVSDGSPYLLTEKEVVLTGLPRYDRLYAAAQNKKMPAKTFLVMPTWRANLAGRWNGEGQKREYNPSFADSLFAKTWKHFFHSEKLKALCLQYGYTALFRPHPGFIDYLDTFELPKYVIAAGGASFQQLLLDARLLITDYSSLAFDMAYLKRPVAYYHFEDRCDFTKGQNRKPGYFDYERDGFGPVCRTEDQLIDCLALQFSRGCKVSADYSARIARTFTVRGGECCKEIVDHIQKMNLAVGGE